MGYNVCAKMDIICKMVSVLKVNHALHTVKEKMDNAFVSQDIL